MALIDAYKLILDAMRLKVTEDGFIKNVDDENIVVAKKSLVLPIPAQLAVSDWSNRIAFNPFRENSLQSTPPAVTEYIRNRFIEHLNVRLFWLMEHLVTIAGDESTHKKLDPEQAKFLVAAKDVDENFINLMQRVADKVCKSEDTTSGAIHIFSKKNGVIDGKKYNRTATVSFPIYQSIKEHEKESKILGVSGWTAKHRKTLAAIFEYIFPEIEKPNSYSVGSDSGICPYMDSLMRAVGKLVEAINAVVETFRSQLDDETIAVVETPVDWYEAFQDLTVYQPEIRLLVVGGESHNVISEPTQAAPAVHQGVVQVTQAGQPVILTMAPAGSGSVIIPMAEHAAALAQGGSGPVNLAAVIANNPALAAQANMGAMMAMPQLAAYYQQMQLMNAAQAKQQRWSAGVVQSASNQMNPNANMVFGHI